MATIFQLPRGYVDAVTALTEAPALTVENQVPTVDETDVPVDTRVALSLFALDGGTINIPSVRIYIGGVLAIDAGWSVNGFTSSWTNGDGGKSHSYDILPPAEFDSLQAVAVRVVATTSLGGSIDSTYTFTAEDLTPPALEGATAIDVRKVHVTFDESMDEATTADPAIFTFAGVDVPTAAVVATAASFVAPNVVEITTDVELSFGKRYSVTVVGARDVWGNVLPQPGNTAEFTAVVPQTPAGRRFDLARMIPAMNFTEDTTGELARFVAVLQDVVDLTLYEIDRFPRALDTDQAPEAFLDAILAELGNPFVSDAVTGVLASETDKRRLARVLVDIYRLKGTAKGIIDVVRFLLGVEVTIDEYFPDGWCLGEAFLGVETVLCPSESFTRYAFQVVPPGPLTDAQENVISAVVNVMRPGHTHFLGIREVLPV